MALHLLGSLESRQAVNLTRENFARFNPTRPPKPLDMLTKHAILGLNRSEKRFSVVNPNPGWSLRLSIARKRIPGSFDKSLEQGIGKMGMELLKQKFLQATGVSLDLLDEHPERMEKIFASDKSGAQQRPVVGRGYPFFEHDGIDAEEKDRQNLEILSKW